MKPDSSAVHRISKAFARGFAGDIAQRMPTCAQDDSCPVRSGSVNFALRDFLIAAQPLRGLDLPVVAAHARGLAHDLVHDGAATTAVGGRAPRR
ncbi:MAG: hypothetical protein K0A92_10695, partial [Methyloprofundus sp.]|nr:hypothetical protein [Methyloprofundus sp.]